MISEHLIWDWGAENEIIRYQDDYDFNIVVMGLSVLTLMYWTVLTHFTIFYHSEATLENHG